MSVAVLSEGCRVGGCCFEIVVSKDVALVSSVSRARVLGAVVLGVL